MKQFIDEPLWLQIITAFAIIYVVLIFTLILAIGICHLTRVIFGEIKERINELKNSIAENDELSETVSNKLKDIRRDKAC